MGISVPSSIDGAEGQLYLPRPPNWNIEQPAKPKSKITKIVLVKVEIEVEVEMLVRVGL